MFRTIAVVVIYSEARNFKRAIFSEEIMRDVGYLTDTEYDEAFHCEPQIPCLIASSIALCNRNSAWTTIRKRCKSIEIYYDYYIKFFKLIYFKTLLCDAENLILRLIGQGPSPLAHCLVKKVREHFSNQEKNYHCLHATRDLLIALFN